MYKGRHILIAPLDWGFGHSTRTAAVIRTLLVDNEITIGVSPNNKSFFKKHFPQVQQVELPSYKIRYSKFLPVWLKIILQWPQVKRVIRSEKKLAAEIILQKKIDLIISDSRFGLYSKNCHSVIISHQLNIRAPFFSAFAKTQNKKLLQQFDEIWVPDHADINQRLSGELSDASGFQKSVSFIGPQSFLNQKEKHHSKKCEVLVILSGPEPQRSSLEELITKAIETEKFSSGMIRGTEKEEVVPSKRIRKINFCSGEELSEWIASADVIVCRSGYSTLMDLAALKKSNVILIPTPGQTEQEYLAHYWNKKFGTTTILQQHIATRLGSEIKTRLHLVP